MKTLYIIGNGFDMAHELNTDCRRFHQYLKCNNAGLKGEFENYFEGLQKEKSWKDFESGLSSFDWLMFFQYHNNLDPENDNNYGSYCCLTDDINEQAENLIQEIRDNFFSWLEGVKLDDLKKIIKLEEDAFFVTFNYTMTLETVYGIPLEQIFHIHNSIEDGADELVVGHNVIPEKEEDLGENGDSNLTPLSAAESGAKSLISLFYKPVGNIIEGNRKTFDSFCNVETIWVLGHSLNEIDLPYFKEIMRLTKDAIWNVTYYEEAEKESHRKTLNSIGVSHERINIIEFKTLFC